MNRKAARAAFKAFVRKSSRFERMEPPEVQARDLITDVLLMFGPDTAEIILWRAEEQYRDERDEVEPVFPDESEPLVTELG